MKVLSVMLGRRGVIFTTPILRQFHSCLRLCRACIIDGVKKSNEIKMKLKEDINSWIASGHRTPHLAVIIVGENPASKVYVKSKTKAAKEIGVETSTISMPTSTSEKCLLDKIFLLNYDPNVDGVLVQLPLPRHISEHKVCNAIAPHKDIDGLNAVNIGRFCFNMKTFIPCTALGVYELLKDTGIETSGKTAVVCGKSKYVGLPIALMLQGDGIGETPGLDATTVICHKLTPPDQLKLFTKSADILIAATVSKIKGNTLHSQSREIIANIYEYMKEEAKQLRSMGVNAHLTPDGTFLFCIPAKGVPHLINGDMVKPGACVIDVGITRVQCENTGKTKLIGDVDFQAVVKVAGHITPVPGGVGPMTVAMLMKNIFLAAQKMVH